VFIWYIVPVWYNVLRKIWQPLLEQMTKKPLLVKPIAIVLIDCKFAIKKMPPSKVHDELSAHLINF
jgi:hypothetical protein